MQKLLYILSAVLLVGCSTSRMPADHALFLDKQKETEYLTAYDNTMKLWPVAYEERNIPTKFGTAHVIVAGPKNAEPLVLLHGMDASSTMWYPNIASYTSKYRVYAIDHIMSSGKSVLIDERPDKDEVVAWYNEVFDALELKKFNLAGISIGGWLATNYTLHNQERIKKLVLLSPVQTFGYMKFNWETRRTVNFKFFTTRKTMKKALEVLSHNPDNISPVYQEQMYLGTLYTHATFDMVGMKPFRKKLKKLTVPTLVLAGEFDILCGDELLAEARKEIPNVQTYLVADAGHFITNDQQEATDRKMMEFLGGRITPKNNDEPAKITQNTTARPAMENTLSSQNK